MSEPADVPESIRQLAEQLGLAKALKLYPSGVKSASERGQKPLGVPAQGISPTASPASIFNPARFEIER